MFFNHLYNARAKCFGTKKFTSAAFPKVPNVLVMTDDTVVYNSIFDRLRAVLNMNRYIVYQLESTSAFVPTVANTALLVAPSPLQNPEKVVDFCLRDGFVLSEEDVGFDELPASFVKLSSKLSSLGSDDWRKLVSKCNLALANNVDDVRPTWGRLWNLSDPEVARNMSVRKTVKQTSLTLNFFDEMIDGEEARGDRLPVLVNPRDCSSFDPLKFNSMLETGILGRTLIHVEVMNSSCDVFEGQFLQDGLAVVVDRQLAGRGRSGNKWLSPKGCAMFSLQFWLRKGSRLAKRISILQHLVGLAAVHGINSARRGLNMRLKWPNDVYAPGGTKLGGVLVAASFQGDKINVNVGMGLNLSNLEPTGVCVNSLLDRNDPLSREEYLAATFNQLERILHSIEEGGDNGMAEVLSLYYEYWMHFGQRVQVKTLEGATIRGTVKSIDDDGFLVVQGESGSTFAVHSDGNSFDMMQGLLAPKAAV